MFQVWGSHSLGASCSCRWRRWGVALGQAPLTLTVPRERYQLKLVLLAKGIRSSHDEESERCITVSATEIWSGLLRLQCWGSSKKEITVVWRIDWLGLKVQSVIPITGEAEAGRSQIQNQSGPQREFKSSRDRLTRPQLRRNK